MVQILKTCVVLLTTVDFKVQDPCVVHTMGIRVGLEERV